MRALTIPDEEWKEAGSGGSQLRAMILVNGTPFVFEAHAVRPRVDGDVDGDPEEQISDGTESYFTDLNGAFALLLPQLETTIRGRKYVLFGRAEVDES